MSAIKVIKRDGTIVDYDRSKIKLAIQKANAEVPEEDRIQEARIDSIIDSIEARRRQRLLVEDIQDMVEHKAHRNLIRISRVCAWGTSRLAFDGSGEILRGRVNLTNDELAALIAMETKDRKKAKGRPETHCGQERCTFLNGKEYNCDLSASYNIGARYFLREWCKVTPGLEETLPKTTQRTYANLKALKPQHSYRKAAA